MVLGFDCQIQDLFAIGDDIARSIADALRAVLVPATDETAHQAILNSPEQQSLPHSLDVAPPSTKCEECQQQLSEWFIYLVAKPKSAYTYHSQRCEPCAKELIMTLVRESSNTILISRFLLAAGKSRLEIQL